MSTSNQSESQIVNQSKSKIESIQKIRSSQTSQLIINTILASSIANMAGITCGHPLDTIRIRIQLESRKITARQCIYESVTKEGPMSLYKGLATPLIGCIPINAIIFYVTEWSKRELKNIRPDMSSSSRALYAGAFAGFCSLSIFVPGDLLKCRKQMTKEGNMSYVAETQAILRQQGLSGLYRGFWASAWRDIPGWAVYFGSFDYLKYHGEGICQRYSSDETNQKRMKFLWLMNAGGMAGVMSWIVSIPQDIIKNKQQCHIGDKPLGMRECFNQLRNDGGMGRIFKGMGPTLARGYIVNVVTLPMFDALMARWQK